MYVYLRVTYSTELVTGLNFRQIRMLVEQMKVAAISSAIVLLGIWGYRRGGNLRESGGLCIIRISASGVNKEG
jgi:PII-like signaling protein